MTIMIKPNLYNRPNSSTMIINERVKQMKKEGVDIISLGFGQSPFPPPKKLVTGLQKHATNSEYLPVQGLLELRQEIAEYYSTRDNRVISAEDVIIGPGSKLLQFLLQFALQDPEIFLPTPAWVSYSAHCRLLNNKLTPLVTREVTDWKLEDYHLDKIRGFHLEKNKNSLFILASPNNPTSTVYNEVELINIAEKLKGLNNITLLDEIYSELAFSPTYFSLAKYSPKNTIISSGISKWLGAGGWRLGFLVFPPELADLRKVVVMLASETYSCATTPVQYACCGLFRDTSYKDYLFRSRKILKALSDHCFKILRTINIRCSKPMGAWYLFLDLSEMIFSFQKRDIYNSDILANRLLEEVGVAVTSSIDFEKSMAKRLPALGLSQN
jgi:aspartate aminotransferase